jgi:hypothetical protein
MPLRIKLQPKDEQKSEDVGNEGYGGPKCDRADPPKRLQGG